MTDMFINVDEFHRHYGTSKMVMKDSIVGWGNGIVDKVFAKQM